MEPALFSTAETSITEPAVCVMFPPVLAINELAAGTIAAGLEEGELAAGQIDTRAIVQQDIAGGVQGQFAG